MKPYVALDSGPLFTSSEFPPRTSHVNFMSGLALGVSVPHGKYRWSVEFRYAHISNVGLSSNNPGLNTVGVRIGFGQFWHRG